MNNSEQGKYTPSEDGLTFTSTLVFSSTTANEGNKLGKENPPNEVKGLLTTFRKKHKLTFTALAALGSISPTTAKRLEHSLTDNPKKSTRAALLRIANNFPNDPLAEAIIATLEKQEEEKIKADEQMKWLRTINSISFELGLRCLRVSEGLSTKEFEKEAEISSNKGKIKKYTREGVRPDPNTLNRLIAASVLDKDGYAAQLLRLKRADLTPMSLALLSQCSYEPLSFYARNLIGLSQREMREIGNKLSLLEGSALASIISKKAQKRNHLVTPEELQQVLDEPYLFAEHIQALPPYVLSDNDQTIIREIDTLKDTQLKTTLGNLLRLTRDRNSITPHELAHTVNMKPEMLYLVETGTQSTDDLTVVRLAKGLGYDIHHPISHKLLENTPERKHTYPRKK